MMLAKKELRVIAEELAQERAAAEFDAPETLPKESRHHRKPLSRLLKGNEFAETF